jgi:adenosylhomocysteine nucleosidase
VIWVLAPTGGEARALERVCPLASRPPWRLFRIGMGPRRAEHVTRELLARGRPRAVLLVGLAGGLDPSLAVGDVVVADGHHPAPDGDAADAIATGAALTARLVRELGRERIPHRVGAFVTSHRVLADPVEKRAFGEHGWLAVEMEGLGVARACRDHDVPCASLRVVLDPVDHRLPDLSGAIDAEGEVRLARLALCLARRPWVVADLPPMVRAARTGHGVLADVVRRIAHTLVD